MVQRNRKEQYNKERIPEGITNNCPEGRSFPINSLGTIAAGTKHTSTFDVEPKHEPLKEGEIVKGVSFNVETVPSPLPGHLNKPSTTHQDLITSIKSTCANHYRKENNNNGKGWKSSASFSNKQKEEEISIEAMSKVASNENLVHLGANGFIMACATAFAQHLPLKLAPDHIWSMITYAFAKHVDLHAEELRKNFVKHEGKKKLEVETPNNFAMSNLLDPDTGASTEEWERFVFPQFSSQIQSHVGDETHSAIVSNFTTTTPTAKAASEITLMSAMKNYFEYKMTTRCGISNITLLGTEEDWISLRKRAEHLGTLTSSEFSKYWMPLLLPVLDEFVQSYQGNVNYSFWQSMVKLRDTGGGSGSYSFISGWIQILAPYLASGDLNKGLRPWHEMYFQGPELGKFPLVSSSAPVEWEYLDKKFNITFHAGMIGFTQDADTGALSPALGWYVSHVPSQKLTKRIIKAEKQEQKNEEEKNEESFRHRINIFRQLKKNAPKRHTTATTTTQGQINIFER